jgi:hypothetical protein
VPEVTMTLTADEALVLFELLHRWEDSNTIDPVLQPGEQVALWAVSAQLERTLVEPFQEDYGDQVESARQRLHARGGA